MIPKKAVVFEEKKLADNKIGLKATLLAAVFAEFKEGVPEDNMIKLHKELAIRLLEDALYERIRNRLTELENLCSLNGLDNLRSKELFDALFRETHFKDDEGVSDE